MLIHGLINGRKKVIWEERKEKSFLDMMFFSVRGMLGHR